MKSIDQRRFKKALNRNLLFPIFFGFISILFFVGIILYLLSMALWMEQKDATINTSNILIKLIVDQETSMRGFVITRNDEYLQPYAHAAKMLPATIDNLKKTMGDDSEQADRLEVMLENYRQWNDYAEEVIKLRGKNIPIEKGMLPKGKELMDKIRADASALLAEQIQIRSQHIARARTLVIVLVGGFLAVSLMLSGVLAHLGRKQIMSLVSSYEKLLHDLDLQNNALHDEEWLRVSELGLAEQIIGQLPLPILCQNILTYLAQRIDLLVGAIYVTVNEETYRREANYGFAKMHAKDNQVFSLGEGLVGQAALENRIIRLNEAPPNYLKVNSGLGEISALHVLLVPIRAETAVVAVLELAFLRDIQQRDFVLLERIAANIGAAIVAAIYRRRLNDTLREMQQLNDELQTQQAELQIANEELETQSKILEESQQRLESQHLELEQVNKALSENNEILRGTRNLLEQRAIQLEQASRYKSEFLANMSHELRTPLNSALILSKLLADNSNNNLTSEQVRFANAIHSAGKDLLALINDVLDLSKVEAGKVTIAPRVTSVVRVVEAIKTYFEPVAIEKRLSFVTTIDQSVPSAIYTDQQRLEQILRNLLSNSFKFTAGGGVNLSVRASENDMVEFSVSDSGIGISADKHELIFEPFHQIDAASNRKFGGAGLGLSISRDLSHLLGGTLSVSSAPEKGSTFTLKIPMRSKDSGAGESALASTASIEWDGLDKKIAQSISGPLIDFSDDRDAVKTHDKLILVVENEMQFAHILYDLAHELNYYCLVANSADEAFDLAIEHRPTAILLDMKLPEQSGLSVLGRLKDEPLTRHIPVHVLSVEEKSSVALRMGAASYALKPITHEQLKTIFQNIEKDLTHTSKNILIVENFEKKSESIARLITGQDVNVTTVGVGEHALQKLQEKFFDCMIIDYELSDMTASQLLSRMAAIGSDSLPPVIVYSRRNLNRTEEDELLRHSASIIIKGVRSSERLLDEVTLFLHRVEADLPDERLEGLRKSRRQQRDFENRKILIVDDDVRNIFALTSVLERRGAKVVTGKNGLDALRRLDEDDAIDLVLMDIMMPEMDGYEAIERIRQDRRFLKLPIIAITAKSTREDQETCLRVGASDYAAKPLNIDRLMSLIKGWLPQVEYLQSFSEGSF